MTNTAPKPPMTNTAPIELEQLFRFWRGLPHQTAAVSELQEAFKQPGATYATVMRRDQPWFKTWSTDGKQADPELVTMAQATAVFNRQPSASQLADLNACLRRFNITTPARIRHFLAQCGHESGGLRWMLELASGDAYEGRTDLGNTQRGDGPRFKGAGAIQLTGRFNYQRFADFIKDPQVMQGADYVATKYPFTSAGLWWHLNGMNQLVDGGASVRAVSARVNGRDPANGLNDRMAYYERALQQLPDPAAPRPALQQPELKPPTTAERTQWVAAVKALNLSQPDEVTCQSACIAMAVGDRDIAKIRRELTGRGDAGNPAVMAQVIRNYGRPYIYDGNGSMAKIYQWLQAGEFLITHGWFTGSGHVICLDGLKRQGTGYELDVKDPWSQFNEAAWAYNLGSKFYDGFYSDRCIYAACCAGASVTDAKRIYQTGRVDTAKGGMWVHRFLTS